jgi:hypothetical protein
MSRQSINFFAAFIEHFFDSNQVFKQSANFVAAFTSIFEQVGM